MKMLISALKFELRPTPTTERITRICFVTTLLCFTALMVIAFTAP